MLGPLLSSVPKPWFTLAAFHESRLKFGKMRLKRVIKETLHLEAKEIR